MKKLLALLLALVMVFALAACNNNNDDPTDPPVETDPPATEAPTEWEGFVAAPSAAQLVANKEYGVDEDGDGVYESGDYVDLYEVYGDLITLNDVMEDELTGLAYIEIDGERQDLGMDFLSMAMVYKTVVDGMTEDEAYARWWKYYITRWNYLMPEVPLYSNEYFDVYNAQIKGVQEYPTNPYWGPAAALIDWSSEKADNSIILGSSTDLSGLFRYASYGGTSPGSSNLDVQNLTTGLETVVTTKEGGYTVNETVVEKMDVTDNDDGTRTYTITIKNDMTFSDGSPVMAKNYLYHAMVFSSPVAAQAAGKDHQSMMSYVGFDAYNKFDGTNDGVDGASKVMTGIRLLGDYQFSATVAADYLPYYYAIAYAGFSPTHQSLWMGGFDVADDGNGCYITGDFYAKEGDSYTHAAYIDASANNTDNTIPYSGPYCVESYDASTKEATLVINPNFKGNYEGTKPSIGKVIYKKIVGTTQIADFQAGGLDVLAAITGGKETDEAIKMCDDSNGKYVYTNYSRAGYGKLSFRADYGPTQFVEVRRALAFCMERAKFATDFTGGYGGVVDGPYYTGSWMYKAAVADGMLLDAYDTSVDTAIALLEEAGWIYNAEGKQYTEGVRYKRISGEYASENDKNFKSVDGAYTTVEIDGDYYMPLVLNWYGTVDNEFTDLLVTGFEQSANVTNAGFVVYKTTGDFAPMLDELYQAAIYGYYSGTPMYTCFNFATGFTSAAYDYSWNWRLEPYYFENYSVNYVKDEADIYWLNN